MSICECKCAEKQAHGHDQALTAACLSVHDVMNFTAPGDSTRLGACHCAVHRPQDVEQRAIDIRAARAAPGVVAIVTADDAGTRGKGENNAAKLLAGPEVAHDHQAVAIVVAGTFEGLARKYRVDMYLP